MSSLKKSWLKYLSLGSLFLSGLAWAPQSQASTQARQFQLNGGAGLFLGTDGLGTSFDVSLEPEFFFTEHNTLSVRMDFTVGETDSFHIGGRWRYYFDLPSPKVNLYVGLGIGGLINFHGSNFGEAALPVFGWQYDIGEHFKVGSEVSLNILFNGSNMAFASRLMPIVVKWAF